MFLYLLFSIRYLFYFFISLFQKQKVYKSKLKKQNEKFIPYKTFISTNKKPLWVKNEIIKIKAINPSLSSRTIANIFNSKFNVQTVGKTYVSYTLKNHEYEILEFRKKFKNRLPFYIKFNTTWGVDLTFINQKPILGVIEHTSRKLLTLKTLNQKSSVVILKVLLEILEYHPKPKFIRTDNEIIFKSKLFKFSLWFLGIKHQTTQIASPWQNGRIERLFGTLKNSISLLKYDKNELGYLCYSFQFWYNNIRFHKNLNYKTPEFVYQQNIDELYKNKQRE